MLASKNIEIRTLEKQTEVLRTNNARLQLDAATLKGNNSTLEGALNQCNAGVEKAALAAQSAANAGRAAAAEAKVTRQATANAVSSIKAMPSATCEDAEAILRAGGQ